MAHKRKPPPTHIFREERFALNGGSTRQSFDEKQYLGWRQHADKYPPKDPESLRFYVGEIAWHKA